MGSHDEIIQMLLQQNQQLHKQLNEINVQIGMLKSQLDGANVQLTRKEMEVEALKLKLEWSNSLKSGGSKGL